MRRDQLDEAIDTVAARLTQVAEDEGLGQRIISELPERTTWLVWVSASWALRLAVIALATSALAVVLRTFYDGSTDVLRTESATAPVAIVELPSNDRRTIVEPPLIVRRTTVEPSLNVRRTEADFEFSLPAIEAVAALGVDALTPASLAVDGPLTVESLEIADLPLTSESFAPR